MAVILCLLWVSHFFSPSLLLPLNVFGFWCAFDFQLCSLRNWRLFIIIFPRRFSFPFLVWFFPPAEKSRLNERLTHTHNIKVNDTESKLNVLAANSICSTRQNMCRQPTITNIPIIASNWYAVAGRLEERICCSSFRPQMAQSALPFIRCILLPEKHFKWERRTPSCGKCYGDASSSLIGFGENRLISTKIGADRASWNI